LLMKSRVFRGDFDYHLIRASMVIIFLFFGYQKWFQYEAQGLIPYISHGPLIFWMYPVFGIRGATYFLGVAEWLFGALLFLGFWNKIWGFLGVLVSFFSFVATVTIIPFIQDGWAASAGGFPAMTERVAFLMKDLVLLAASFYLLKQDLVRMSLSDKHPQATLSATGVRTGIEATKVAGSALSGEKKEAYELGKPPPDQTNKTNGNQIGAPYTSTGL